MDIPTNILTNDQVDQIVSSYDYFKGEEDFIEKTLKKFPLNENELRMVFRLLNLGFIKWSQIKMVDFSIKENKK